LKVGSGVACSIENDQHNELDNTECFRKYGDKTENRVWHLGVGDKCLIRRYSQMDNKNMSTLTNLEDRTNVIYDLEFQVGQITSTDLYHPEPIQILTRVREELENRQHICVTSLSCVAVHQLYLLELISQYRPRQINDDNLEREHRRTQLMTQLLESEKCRDVMRMGPEAFRA
ncbi:hypothetical protein HN51_058943, partial [Arachis hypogaea]